jgi:DNA uptake protein ComE-like DNA-binding protein
MNFARLPAAWRNRRASTFVIVLWIAVGLVSLTLYFGYAMSLELKASDYRTSATAADQAIEGAARYVTYILGSQLTNGLVPDPQYYLSDAVAVGDSHFWLIGRDTNDSSLGEVFFSLVDESSKVNINTASSNTLIYLPNISVDLACAILDWRDTNGGAGTYETYYGLHSPSYEQKFGPFETIDELRLLYDGEMDILLGEDLNRNGVLDPNENDLNRNGVADPGVLEYVTAYTREPNTYSNGTPRMNITNLVSGNVEFQALLQGALGNSRADIVMANLGLSTGGSGGGGGRPGGGQAGGQGGAQITGVTFRSPLELFRRSGMTVDEFAGIEEAITVTDGEYIEGRVNVNTASKGVLASLPGLSSNPELAQLLIDYRKNNPGALSSIGWVVEALGSGNDSVLEELQAEDVLTTRSFQFSADIAALGPHGRGYRRVRFVFDTSEGVPKIVYRQDLTHLGWALGKKVRQDWLLAKDLK